MSRAISRSSSDIRNGADPYSGPTLRHESAVPDLEAALLELPDIEDGFTAGNSFFFLENPEEVQTLRDDISRGTQFSTLMASRPHAVISALRGLAITKLGVFEVKDTDARLAFKSTMILTRGVHTMDDENFKASWISLINAEAAKRYSRDLGGWHEKVRLAAYCVNFMNAAAASEHGVLKPLLRKEKRGTTGDDIWEFPAVQAIIEHKWHHFAYRYLLCEFILYLCWVSTFVGFMLIYIELEEQNLYLCDRAGMDWHRALAGFVCDVFSFGLMIPFALMEINSVLHYKLLWIQVWNIIDTVTYVLQAIISTCHFIGLFYDNHYYNNTAFNGVLAIQCILLVTRLQYYSRVVGVGASYIEALSILIHKIRFFLIFLITFMMSAALAFAVLYKEDVEKYHLLEHKNSNFTDSYEANNTLWIPINRGGDEGGDHDSPDETKQPSSIVDFGSFPRALGTSFAVMMGSFDTSYAYKTSNRAFKLLCFMAFQLMISITVLNIMIAVMTDAFSKIMVKKRIMFYRGRAQLIDRLEVTLPKSWLPRWKPYVHFVVVERQAEQAVRLPALETDETTRPVLQTSFSEEMQNVKQMIGDLAKTVSHLHHKLDASSSQHHGLPVSTEDLI